MGHNISNMIGIRTGGVFGEDTDMDDTKERISKIIIDMKGGEYPADICDDPSHCMSQELQAHKGAYIVIAGVFNYWDYDFVSEFAKRLSSEFQTEIMVMSWDEQNNSVQCNIFLDGKPMFEINENPISRALRSVC